MEKVIELYKKTYLDYALSIFDVEIALHKARVFRMTSRLQSYFNSSQNRNTFARIMAKAYQLKEPVNITEICELLNANRSSVSTMVDECEKEGWITVLRENNKAKCMATKELYNSTMKYVYWKKQINQSIVGDKYKTLKQLEAVLKSLDVPKPDFSYGEEDIKKTSVHPLETLGK